MWERAAAVPTNNTPVPVWNSSLCRRGSHTNVIIVLDAGTILRDFRAQIRGNGVKRLQTEAHRCSESLKASLLL